MSPKALLTQALTEAFQAANLQDGDKGAMALALRYAELLDAARGAAEEPVVFSKLGPPLLAALVALGMTPSGRGAKGGGPGVIASSALDELRARRAKRAGADGSKDLDSASS